LLLAASCMAIGTACSESKEQAVVAPRVVPRTEARPWAAVSYAPSGPPAYLGNGTIGVRLGPYGSGTGLPAFVMWKDVLHSMPNPCAMRLTFGGESAGQAAPLYYKSWLEFRTGVHSTLWKQRVAGKLLQVKVETVADPYLPIVAQRISMWAKDTLEAAVQWEDPEAGEFQPRQVSEMEIADRPTWTLRRETRVAGALAKPVATVRLSPSATVVESVCALEMGTSLKLPSGFQGVAEREARFLAQRWKFDIEVDGPTEDQQAIRSFLYYLYVTASPKMPPMGLSSAKYRGHRFWDAEAWMLPVYALAWPEAARAATEWRLRVSGTGMIPWEAGAGGVAATPPEFASAIHGAGWVGWWLQRAKTLGLCDPRRADAVQAAIAKSFLSMAVERRGSYELLGVVSPDEGRRHDNDLVTNLLAKYIARVVAERSGDAALSKFSRGLKVPKFADGLPASYDRDPAIKYQQTAALLSIYPLEWPFDRRTCEAMFDRFKDKISDAGPAMSDSIHATIAARLERPDEAYGFWRRAWEPFVRRETMQFCERRGSNDSYFLTGAAGCLQSVIYGFLGVRIEDVPPISGKLPFTVVPHLPKAWRSVTLRGARLPGGVFTIRATHSTVSVDKEDNQ
jgi:hypothetical protein